MYINSWFSFLSILMRNIHIKKGGVLNILYLLWLLLFSYFALLRDSLLYIINKSFILNHLSHFNSYSFLQTSLVNIFPYKKAKTINKVQSL